MPIGMALTVKLPSIPFFEMVHFSRVDSLVRYVVTVDDLDDRHPEDANIQPN